MPIHLKFTVIEQNFQVTLILDLQGTPPLAPREVNQHLEPEWFMDVADKQILHPNKAFPNAT